MKKNVIFTLLWTLCFTGCMSSDEPDAVNDGIMQANSYKVSIEEAIENAEQFFSNMENGGTTRGSRIVKDVEIYTSGGLFTRSAETAPDFYVINYADDGGFALVSADSRRFPVYAFSYEGHMNLSDTLDNPGLGDYLRGIAGITPSTPGPSDSIPAVTGSFKVLVKPLIPILPSRWNQMILNKYVQEENGDVPVGCVALAAGQIMSYNQWPDRWPVTGYETASEKYTFDWVEINKTKAHDSACRLMEILGRPEYLSMSYAPDGSSSSVRKLPNLFSKMGYNRPAIGNFNTNIALEYLNRKSPFVMSGYPNNQIPGHAWVIDGVGQYEEPVKDFFGNPVYKIYYHFVWGNTGGSNGYYFYYDSSKSFETYPQFKDEIDYGSGTTGEPYSATLMVYKFEIDHSTIN